MSLGVNVLISLVESAARALDEAYDIEIFEAHHRNKKDAPSGTALALGQAAAAGRQVAFDAVADYARHGVSGPRRSGAVGFSVFRGGDVVGDHTVTFAGVGERIELTHRASDRMAIRARRRQSGSMGRRPRARAVFDAGRTRTAPYARSDAMILRGACDCSV